MNIKEFVFSTQKQLHTLTGTKFKRSHIYELIAASFGFHSYAALNSNAVFIAQESEPPTLTQHKTLINDRCIELGYHTAADTVIEELHRLFMKQRLGVENISELFSRLYEEFEASGSYPEWDEEFSPALIEALESAAKGGNAVAHHTLALIHSPGEDNDASKNSYWYTQSQQGQTLSGVQKEWSDAYENYLTLKEKQIFHLREAGNLGNTDALLDLAELYDDPSFFDMDHDRVTSNPVRVAEIARSLGRTKDEHLWTTLAAREGSVVAMRTLIDEFDCKDLRQCWTWQYLAELLGTDLTKDNYFAIHEDGSEYDDDVGGPMFADGESGIKLESLDTNDDDIARSTAKEYFSQICQSN